MDSRTDSDTTPRAWEGRAVIHMDLDAFFAAVEQLDHPEWRGLPVIVGGDPSARGVVSTASYEARKFGVGSAMAAVRAAELCPQAIWARPRFKRYKELSDAVMSILRSHSPLMQQVSVDEAYVDVSPTRHDPLDPIAHARAIRAAVAELGLTASIGIGTSKTIAKIASDHDKPDGLTVVMPGHESLFLASLPVRALPGIGPRNAERLTSLGIRTLGALAQLDERTARELLGSFGPVAVMRAAGIDDRPVASHESARSVSAERTFPHDLHATPEVHAGLRDLAERVSRRLVGDERSGRTVTVKIRFGDFTTRTTSKTFEHPVAPEDLYTAGLELLTRMWTPGVGVRLLGLGVSGFIETNEQLDLFSVHEDREVPGALESIERIRSRFGHDAIHRGVRRDRIDG